MTACRKVLNTSVQLLDKYLFFKNCRLSDSSHQSNVASGIPVQKSNDEGDQWKPLTNHKVTFAIKSILSLNVIEDLNSGSLHLKVRTVDYRLFVTWFKNILDLTFTFLWS